MILSECCDAREWLDEPQFDVYSGKWMGLCAKCGEHATFYDDSVDDFDQKYEEQNEK